MDHIKAYGKDTWLDTAVSHKKPSQNRPLEWNSNRHSNQFEFDQGSQEAIKPNKYRPSEGWVWRPKTGRPLANGPEALPAGGLASHGPDFEFK